jgi:two-component system sensor histidine kinase DesK
MRPHPVAVTFLVVLPAPVRIRWRVTLARGVRDRLSTHDDFEAALGRATAGLLAASVLLVTVGVLRIALVSPGDSVTAVAATAAYLPLHLRHVHRAAGGIRPAGAGWSLAIMAAITFAALPVVGTQWFGALYPLSASVLLVLSPRWSIPIFASLVALPGVAAAALGGQSWGVYFGAGVLLYGLLLAVPVWLIATARELRQARAALADQAILRERVGIEEQLRGTLGTALHAIARDGEAAGELIVTDPEVARARLTSAVESARTTLAHGRRLTAAFRRPDLLAELGSATALLRGAGIAAQLVPPRGDLPGEPADTLLAGLRAEVARLLADDSVRECTLAVETGGGHTKVEISSMGGSGPSRVTAQ